jgi:hypothetical protein
MCMNLINGAQKAAINNQTYYQALAAQQQQQQQAQQLQQEQAASAAATAKADALAAAAAQQVKSDQGTVAGDFAQFNPDYYSKYRNAYTGYYTPQVADQYGQAKDQLTAALAGNGTLESSAGATALANLAKRNTDQISQIQSQADSATTAQQQKIAAAESGLYSSANAGVDPTQLATNATAQTTALAAPQNYTPLSSVFTDLVTPFSNYTKAAATAPAGTGAIPVIQAVNNNSLAGGAGSPITNSGWGGQ